MLIITDPLVLRTSAQLHVDGNRYLIELEEEDNLFTDEDIIEDIQEEQQPDIETWEIEDVMLCELNNFYDVF